MTTLLKKNAVLNTIKTLCQVIFPIITIPYVSRTLGTVGYGKVNYTASIISYFSILGAFGINNYATREGARIRDDREKLKNLADQLFTINIITSLISLLVLCAIVLGFFSDQDYRVLLLVQGVTIFFSAIGAEWVNTIFEDYKYITIRYICVQIISLILLIMLVKSSKDYILYAAILTIANSGANLFNMYYIKRYIRLQPRLSSEIMRHFKPMLMLVMYSFTLTIYVNSDTTILGILKGDLHVGIYSIAAKIYLVVKQVLNAGIMVSVPRIASILGKGELTIYKKLLHSIFDFLLMIVLPSMVGLFMLSDEVIFLAGGIEYADASLPLKILCVSLSFAVFGCYFSNCYLLPNKQDKAMLGATISGCISNIVLNFFMIPIYSYVGAAITTLIAEIIVCSICYLNSKNIAIITVNKRNLLSVLFGCLMIVIACLMSKQIGKNVIIKTVVSILLSVIGYGTVLVIFKNTVVMSVLKKGRNIKKI